MEPQSGLQSFMVKLTSMIGSVDNVIIFITLAIGGLIGALIVRMFSRKVGFGGFGSLFFGVIGGIGAFYLLWDVLKLFEKIYLFDFENNLIAMNIWPAVACGIGGGFILTLLFGLIKAMMRG